MPRKAREKSETKVYHVILRGNAKQDIFFDKQDYSKFIKEISNTKEKYQYDLYAYCLMTNHIHLVIYDKNDELSKILQSLTVSYSAYFNKKYERIGHLFQNRFLSKNVEASEYLKNLCRYIHQNPSKSGIAKTEEYLWSSYQEYIGDSKIVEKKQLLRLFNINKKEAIKEFIKFHSQDTRKNDLNDFSEYEIGEKLTDEKAMQYLKEFLEIKDIQELANYSMLKRNEYLKKMKNIKGVSNLQIARITGFSRRIIENAMK